MSEPDGSVQEPSLLPPGSQTAGEPAGGEGSAVVGDSRDVPAEEAAAPAERGLPLAGLVAGMLVTAGAALGVASLHGVASILLVVLVELAAISVLLRWTRWR